MQIRPVCLQRLKELRGRGGHITSPMGRGHEDIEGIGIKIFRGNIREAGHRALIFACQRFHEIVAEHGRVPGFGAVQERNFHIIDLAL